MRWLLKAYIQKIVSVLPWSASLNYAMRKYASRTLPVKQSTFEEMLAIAEKHYGFFLRHSPAESLHNPFFFEFGAGWDLISQLYYHSRGIKKQYVVDIKPHARLALINDTIRRLKRYTHTPAGGTDQKTDSNTLASMSELETIYGIQYLAPCDMRKTNFPSASFDFISSTSTLEHIPVEDLGLLLTECRRLLKPNCCISCIIDTQDHYSYVDRNISIYNFLTFSDQQWASYNSPLHFQNRLRYLDYSALFKNAGFEILACQTKKPKDSELALLKSLRIDNKFKGSLEDLGVKTIWLLARNPH
jgi:SAM-dependent methyltransferase